MRHERRLHSSNPEAATSESPVSARPRRAPRARIVRVPIFHQGTFQAILAAVWQSGPCLRYRGQSWEPIEQGRGFGFYRRAPFGLGWIEERVEQYEFHLYHRLLQEEFGRDGLLRARTQFRLGPNGARRAVFPRCRLSSENPGSFP